VGRTVKIGNINKKLVVDDSTLRVEFGVSQKQTYGLRETPEIKRKALDPISAERASPPLYELYPTIHGGEAPKRAFLHYCPVAAPVYSVCRVLLPRRSAAGEFIPLACSRWKMANMNGKIKPVR
jgi:hypothetical protein